MSSRTPAGPMVRAAYGGAAAENGRREGDPVAAVTVGGDRSVRPGAAARRAAAPRPADGPHPSAAGPSARPSRPAGRAAGGAAGWTRGVPGHRPGGIRRRDEGSASIEFLGFLPVLLIVALAAVQLGLAAYTAQQAGTAARAAARTASLDTSRTSPAAAGQAAMSGWLADGADVSSGGCGGGQASATATVEIPSVIPGFDFGSARRSATMPCDDGSDDIGGAVAGGGDR
ncbi:TadE/TadG family type IV pilus assembly protein [Streptomyces sp. HD1123-B1]|uniref:TadE/TadG family type IV pilus assembly protein n=1 Tax=Streptomyces huangiella TaxID=3228804 RepID=UPI003D7D0816